MAEETHSTSGNGVRDGVDETPRFALVSRYESIFLMRFRKAAWCRMSLNCRAFLLFVQLPPITIGHSDINVTRKIYARFSPSYLKDAAAALEMDDLGPTDRGALPRKRLSPLKSLPKMVGATGIEPVTPTMSR
jgi:hypothetical protein